ncbi:TetR/AcrR family transcriptional regulator [Hyphobacterium sp. WM6]|uniref:TetR/AcrR family transcriptional regulator n=1 Tax=Hyphobacterium sp. WM6 TaxID=3140243 RepID=UPI0031B68D9F
MIETPDSVKPDTRSAILDATETVIVRDGARRTTIDAVVAESGFSKGGVLYHFPSKSALLQGLVQRLVGEFEADLDRAATEAASHGEPVERRILSILMETSERKKRIAGALLGVTAEEPDLIIPARELKARIEKSLLKRARDPLLARIVMLAIDGMSYREMLGFGPLTPADRDQVRDRLLSLTEDIYS